jgi:hypothetical protein
VRRDGKTPGPMHYLCPLIGSGRILKVRAPPQSLRRIAETLPVGLSDTREHPALLPVCRVAVTKPLASKDVNQQYS